MKNIFLLLLMILLPGYAGAAAPSLIDGEVHILDFNQSGDSLEQLFSVMDAADVRGAWVMGVPLQKVWQEHAPQRPRAYESDDAPVYYYSATDIIVANRIMALPPEQRERLYPFICGFNPTDRNAVNHIRLMLEMYPGLWSGIGEILTRHDALTRLTYGETARADHPALDDVYKLAAARCLPVLLHSNITSNREPDFIYLGEVERAVAAHPETMFIWAHAGCAANIERRQHLEGLDVEVARLLEHYPNLSIMLSWTLVSSYLLDGDGLPQPEWLELVSRYPQRFMVGSDIVGRFEKLPAALDKVKTFLSSLPPEVAEQVGSGNALRMTEARCLCTETPSVANRDDQK
jgi:hypothetical protein